MHQRILKVVAVCVRALQFLCSLIVLGISAFIASVYPYAFEPLLSLAVSVIILIYVIVGMFIHSFVPVAVSLIIEIILTILAISSFGVEAYAWALAKCSYVYVEDGYYYSETINGCVLGKVSVAFAALNMILFFISLILVAVYGFHATKQRHGNVMHKNLSRGLLHSQLELDYTVHYVGEQNSPTFNSKTEEKNPIQPVSYPIPSSYDPHFTPPPQTQYSQTQKHPGPHSGPHSIPHSDPHSHPTPPQSNYHESTNSFVSQPPTVSTQGFAPHQPVPESRLENPSFTNLNQRPQNTGPQNIPVDQFGNPIHY